MMFHGSLLFLAKSRSNSDPGRVVFLFELTLSKSWMKTMAFWKSMVWLEGKSTGNHRFVPWNRGFSCNLFLRPINWERFLQKKRPMVWTNIKFAIFLYIPSPKTQWRADFEQGRCHGPILAGPGRTVTEVRIGCWGPGQPTIEDTKKISFPKETICSWPGKPIISIIYIYIIYIRIYIYIYKHVYIYIYI